MTPHQARARVAGLKRRRPADDPDVLAAERDLAAANVEAKIRRVVAAAPPLSAEQVERIRALLPAPASEAADAAA